MEGAALARGAACGLLAIGLAACGKASEPAGDGAHEADATPASANEPTAADAVDVAAFEAFVEAHRACETAADCALVIDADPGDDGG